MATYQPMKVEVAAQYQAALDDYKNRMPVRAICEKHGLAKNTLMRAVNAVGIEKRKGSGSYAPSVEQHADRVFDKFKAIPETPCGCGKGCGLTFKKTVGQRCRKWAKDCPYAAEQRRDVASIYNRKRARELAARARANGPARMPRGGTPPRPERKAIHWCCQCGGLPHRRPKNAACKCGLTFEQDSFQTLGGFTIVVEP